MKDLLKFIWYAIMMFIGILGAVIWASDIFQDHEHSLWVSIPFSVVSAYTGIFSFLKVREVIE